MAKDRDCIGCVKILDCKGKPKPGALCINKKTAKEKPDRDVANYEEE